jgi:Xaa-Pro aminopeptidase
MQHRIPEEEVNAFLEAVKPVFEKYKGIGVRIEDDILITEKGNRILSAKAPRTVKDIEKVMAGR